MISDGVDVNALDDLGQTPLVLASTYKQHGSTYELLLIPAVDISVITR